MNFFDKDLQQVHEDLVNKKVSAKELTQAVIDNIKNHEAQLHAFLRVNEAEALAAAEKVDEEGIKDDQLLAGIPLAVKDNILTDGITTTAASKMLEHFKPVYDATVISKLKEQRFINVGKTNLDEFAMGSSTENSAFGPTHNPWNTDYVPGGSSGGSGAAVGAGEVLGALGTDTGGSVRMPGSLNGVVGSKPTYGRVSRYGIVAFGSSFDQVGWLTQNVKDNAYLTSVISGHDEHDMTSSDREVPDFAAGLNDSTSVKGLRIGLPKEYMTDAISPAVRKGIEDAAKLYESLGATLDEVSLPHTEDGIPVYYILATAEASSNLGRYDGIRYGFRASDAKNIDDVYVKSRSEGFGPEVKRRIMLGTFALSAGSYDAYFMQAAKVRRMMANDFVDVFKNYDLIMAPMGTDVAFKLGSETQDPTQMYMNDILSVPANMAGLPSMSVPAGFSKGLPFGMQLIGKPFDEQTMFNAGYVFEQNTDYHKQHPQLGGQN